MIDELLQQATKQLELAYSPYSHFNVGAAVLTEDNKIFGGSNIENISFSPTICAERVAIFSAVAAGHRHFRALLVTSDTKEPVMPCGVCRQVINEFFDYQIPIFLTNQKGQILETDINRLLPGSFNSLE